MIAVALRIQLRDSVVLTLHVARGGIFQAQLIVADAAFRQQEQRSRCAQQSAVMHESNWQLMSHSHFQSGESAPICVRQGPVPVPLPPFLKLCTVLLPNSAMPNTRSIGAMILPR